MWGSVSDLSVIYLSVRCVTPVVALCHPFRLRISGSQIKMLLPTKKKTLPLWPKIWHPSDIHIRDKTGLFSRPETLMWDVPRIGPLTDPPPPQIDQNQHPKGTLSRLWRVLDSPLTRPKRQASYCCTRWHIAHPLGLTNKKNCESKMSSSLLRTSHLTRKDAVIRRRPQLDPLSNRLLH